jgi:hypothetical protein
MTMPLPRIPHLPDLDADDDRPLDKKFLSGDLVCLQNFGQHMPRGPIAPSAYFGAVALTKQMIAKTPDAPSRAFGSLVLETLELSLQFAEITLYTLYHVHEDAEINRQGNSLHDDAMADMSARMGEMSTKVGQLEARYKREHEQNSCRSEWIMKMFDMSRRLATAKTKGARSLILDEIEALGRHIDATTKGWNDEEAKANTARDSKTTPPKAG